MDVGSTAATIYAAFRARLVRDILHPLLGPLASDAFARAPNAAVSHVARLRGRLADWIREDDRTLLAAGDDWGSVMARALAGAVATLRETLGPDPASWAWGRLHQSHVRAIRSRGCSRTPRASSIRPRSPAGGDGDTVQAADFVPAAGFELSLTSVARYVFDLGDWERSAWIVPLGASGHPGQPALRRPVARTGRPCASARCGTTGRASRPRRRATSGSSRPPAASCPASAPDARACRSRAPRARPRAPPPARRSARPAAAAPSASRGPRRKWAMVAFSAGIIGHPLQHRAHLAGDLGLRWSASARLPAPVHAVDAAGLTLPRRGDAADAARAHVLEQEDLAAGEHVEALPREGIEHRLRVVPVARAVLHARDDSG